MAGAGVELEGQWCRGEVEDGARAERRSMAGSEEDGVAVGQGTQEPLGACVPAGAKRWAWVRVERLGVGRGVALLVVTDGSEWRWVTGAGGGRMGHNGDGLEVEAEQRDEDERALTRLGAPNHSGGGSGASPDRDKDGGGRASEGIGRDVGPRIWTLMCECAWVLVAQGNREEGSWGSRLARVR